MTDRWAIVTKIHHCMVDGILPAPSLMAVDAPTRSRTHQTARAPRSGSLGASPGGARDRPRGACATARGQPRRPSSAAARRAAISAPRPHGRGTPWRPPRGCWTFAGILRPPSQLFAERADRPATAGGDWGQKAALDGGQGDSHCPWGGTVNDVVLASIAGGFRAPPGDARRDDRPSRAARSVPRSRSGRVPRRGTYNKPCLGDLRRPPRGRRGPRSTGSPRSGPKMERLKHSHEAVAGGRPGRAVGLRSGDAPVPRAPSGPPACPQALGEQP